MQHSRRVGFLPRASAPLPCSRNSKPGLVMLHSTGGWECEHSPSSGRGRTGRDVLLRDGQTITVFFLPDDTQLDEGPETP